MDIWRVDLSLRKRLLLVAHCKLRVLTKSGQIAKTCLSRSLLKTGCYWSQTVSHRQGALLLDRTILCETSLIGAPLPLGDKLGVLAIGVHFDVRVVHVSVWCVSCPIVWCIKLWFETEHLIVLVLCDALELLTTLRSSILVWVGSTGVLTTANRLIS